MTQRDFQTPLAKVKGLGSAHDGVNHWVYQRISAVALIVLGLWLVCSLSYHGDDSYADVVTWLANPWTASGMFLFISAVTFHAVLGIQVIIEDYVHAAFWRYASLLILKFLMISIPVLSLFFLIKIAFLGSK
ncbi:succinate dehydrogenase, hydrophobic membrane anchor protein [Candidatus Paracaedibacter symbiosus]|uniref:succinate dehydrogenase, hydrophobic membrane anchor protein n=1 Tax=Candidatus Paracaedibacter symbiosus TaxID=244582 RepID=UPI0005095A60|nr:succinate dehydrogenase, hydrophobic membrane anchor protein [Candidatus Paracaedibacter symbiosus]